jgi:toxin ParE1/3/4
LTNRTKQISAFPFSGEMVPEYNVEKIREAIEYSYRLIYLVENESIYVLAVIRGALPLPDSPPLNTG